MELLLEAARQPASLEAPVGDSDETRLADLVRDVVSSSPEEAAIRSEMADEVERAMAPLNAREREVVRLRYGLGTDREFTLEEIGRRLSLTRERVRQIETKAVLKMRAARGARPEPTVPRTSETAAPRRVPPSCRTGAAYQRGSERRRLLPPPPPKPPPPPPKLCGFGRASLTVEVRPP